jgi:uncharacterized protein YwqG
MPEGTGFRKCHKTYPPLKLELEKVISLLPVFFFMDVCDLDDQQSDSYNELEDICIRGRLSDYKGEFPYGDHRVLGWANPVQQGPTTANADDWHLLLQLDSDDISDFSWVDMGRIYFQIHEEDLKRRRFDRIVLELECT